VLNFILQAVFLSDQHLYEKREGSGFVPLTNGTGSPKNMIRILKTGRRAFQLKQEKLEKKIIKRRIF
jgi:hypothetical protein